MIRKILSLLSVIVICLCVSIGCAKEEVKDSYVFEYRGTSLKVNDDIAPVLQVLGEPVNYYEATSCAFEGLDKIYTYAGFQIDTFPKGDKDIIACIYFRDDTVKTLEGISLYMTREDMLKAYGEATEVSGSAYIYRKGDGFLRFILNESDEIVSIEYQTETTYK